MKNEDTKPDSRNSPHFLSEAFILYILPTDDLRRLNKMSGVFSGGLTLRFGGCPPTCPPIHPHRPHTTKQFTSNAFTSTNIHLCQKSTSKHHHGRIFLSSHLAVPGVPAARQVLAIPAGPAPARPEGPASLAVLGGRGRLWGDRDVD